MMKHGPMDWQFGDDGLIMDEPEAGKNSGRAREPIPNRRRTWLLIFLLALITSWTTGFYLGRVQQSTAALEAEIQGQLDIESWAWQQADWDLFRSLLPPRTPRWRVRALQRVFTSNVPKQLDLKLAHYGVSENGDQVEADVQVSAAGDSYDVERTYRLIDGRWRLMRLGEFEADVAQP